MPGPPPSYLEGTAVTWSKGPDSTPTLCGQQPYLSWTLLPRTGMLWKLVRLLGWISIRPFPFRRKLGISIGGADESFQEADCLRGTPVVFPSPGVKSGKSSCKFRLEAR